MKSQLAWLIFSSCWICLNEGNPSIPWTFLVDPLRSKQGEVAFLVRWGIPAFLFSDFGVLFETAWCGCWGRAKLSRLIGGLDAFAGRLGEVSPCEPLWTKWEFRGGPVDWWLCAMFLACWCWKRWFPKCFLTILYRGLDMVSFPPLSGFSTRVSFSFVDS